MIARLLFLFALGVSPFAYAGRTMPLTKLPDEKLIALAPLLAHGDLALVESNADGTMKQVTLILFVAAPPETVHQVLSHPGDYKNFVPNVSRSSWTPEEGGGGISKWQLDLPVSSFEATDRYRFEPGPRGAVLVTSPDENDDGTFRWEFLPVSGGTVMVQYGYCDVKHANALVRSFLKKIPVTEHGLALAAQLLLAANMKREAEKRTPKGSLPPLDTRAAGPGFDFLLARGQVAILRSRPDGHFSDASILDRVYAGPKSLLDALTRPGAWKRFVPGVGESVEREHGPSSVEFSAEFSVPLVTWATRWSMRWNERAVEGVGVAGDLAGAHFQWDLRPRGDKETLVVYRVNQSLGRASVVARKLFEYEPSLEHGLNVAFSLVYLRAMRGFAEGWGAR